MPSTAARIDPEPEPLPPPPSRPRRLRLARGSVPAIDVLGLDIKIIAPPDGWSPVIPLSTRGVPLSPRHRRRAAARVAWSDRAAVITVGALATAAVSLLALLVA